MKSIKLFGLLAVLSAGLTSAMAQKKTEQDNNLSKQMDKTLTSLSKIEISKSSEVQKVAATQLKEEWVANEGLRLLNEETERKRKEIENKEKEYVPVPGKTKYLDKDLLPLLADMPEPQSNLPSAKQAMKVNIDEDVYSKYIEKLKRIREQMAEVARNSIPADQKDPEKVKNEAYKNAASVEQSLNNNPLIQQMGGIEKLKNMTPEQRAELAKQMTANVKNNPSAYTGQESDPRKAFTKKMMTDPNYAARYNGMNDQQKQEEYNTFLSENGFANNSSHANLDKTLADRNKAAAAIAIDKRTGLILDHAKELATIVGSIQKRTDDYFNELNKKLSDDYARRAEALPLVEHGEAGKSKDTYPLDIAYNVVLYSIHVKNAIANKAIWKSKAEMLKVLIADHNDFLGEFLGKDKTTDRLMTERGLIPAAIVASLCDELIKLTQEARFLTNQNAGWQKTYEMIVLHVND
jgi:hypothetical protein